MRIRASRYAVAAQWVKISEPTFEHPYSDPAEGTPTRTNVRVQIQPAGLGAQGAVVEMLPQGQQVSNPVVIWLDHDSSITPAVDNYVERDDDLYRILAVSQVGYDAPYKCLAQGDNRVIPAS